MRFLRVLQCRYGGCGLICPTLRLTHSQTMEKKDQKLKEIEAVLTEEIQPAVEKLKKQCGEYNEWAELSSCRYVGEKE